MYEAAGQHAKQLVRGRVCDQSASGSEFDVGGASTDVDIPGELRWQLWLRVSIKLA